jgi:hypothetical protein
LHTDQVYENILSRGKVLRDTVPKHATVLAGESIFFIFALLEKANEIQDIRGIDVGAISVGFLCSESAENTES